MIENLLGLVFLVGLFGSGFIVCLLFACFCISLMGWGQH